MKIKKIPYYKDYSKYLEIQGKNPIILEWPKYKAQTKEKPILIFTKISGLILSPWAQNLT